MAVSFRSFTVWSFDGLGKAIPNRTPEGSTPEDLVLYCARHDYLSRRSSSARRRTAIIHKSRLTAVGELEQLECKGIHVPIHVTPKNGSHLHIPDDVAKRLAAGGGDVPATP
jgi:hypothetical protein